jgi:hypothetical protein
MLSVVSIKISTYHLLHDGVSSRYGYFTNLKALYKNLEGMEVHSYPTICNHLKKKGFYRFLGSSEENNNSHKRLFVRIKLITLNQLYSKSNSLSMDEILHNSLIKQDVELMFHLTRNYIQTTWTHE